MIGFQKQRFLGFPLEKQHKKCAELLRLIYENEEEKAVEQYLTLAEWMGLELLDLSSKKNVSNRYHRHLKQGNLAKKEHNLLPMIRKEDREECESNWYPISIYLDHIRSAHNVGSILRTTEACRLGEVHFSEQTPFTDNKQVQDASMGTSDQVPCCKGSALSELRRPIIALETAEDAHSLHDYSFPESFTLVVGNEEYGCSDQTLREADFLLEIPLRGKKNSLNVANAFAIAAAEIVRQKQQKAKV